MDKFGFCTVILTAIIGLLTVSCVAIKHEDNLIKQSDNLEKMCLKAYKSDLKNDSEIKELCKNVKIKLFE